VKIQKSHLKELIRQAIKEDDEWWEKMTPPEQAEYVKKHPGSEKAQQVADKGDEEKGKSKEKKDTDKSDDTSKEDLTKQQKRAKKKKYLQKTKKDVKDKKKEEPVKAASPKEIKKSQEKLGNIKKGEEEIKKAEQEVEDAENKLVLWPEKKIAKAKENLAAKKEEVKKATDERNSALNSGKEPPATREEALSVLANVKTEKSAIDKLKADVEKEFYEISVKKATPKQKKQLDMLQKKLDNKEIDEKKHAQLRTSALGYKDKLDKDNRFADANKKGEELEKTKKKTEKIQGDLPDSKSLSGKSEKTEESVNNNLSTGNRKMKITKNQLKELIRLAIDEASEENGEEKGDNSGEEQQHQITPIDTNPFEKEDMEESVNRKRTTVKEVKMWMKKLEENRYKKTYNSDCRRVAWLVNNNLSEDYETMPKSMRKKWTKAQYGRERYLAKEYIKHLDSKELTESKIRKVVRNIIKEELNEAKAEIVIDLKDFDKVKKIVKKIKGQLVKHSFAKKTFGVKVDKNQYNKALEFLMKNKINPRG